MNKDISAYSYPGNKYFSHRHSMLLFFCALFSVLCFLIFSACATTPDTKDINRAEAYNKLGYSYLKNAQINKAYVEFQKAIKLNPENKETLNYLGYINYKYNKYDEAIAHYKRAIAIDPKYADAINNLGVVYLDIKNWDEAIQAFTTALDNPLYSTPERAYTSMGHALYMKGEYQKAESALREALMRNPVYALAYYTLGLVYVKLGDDEKAIEEFNKAIALHVDYLDAHWELANIYLRTGRNAKAMKHLEIVAEKDIERGKMAIEQIEKLKY